MCRSVPQIEAAFTHTSTSPCPISGTGTVSSCKPLAACVFRSAFIVAGIRGRLLAKARSRLSVQTKILAHALVSFILPALFLRGLEHSRHLQIAENWASAAEDYLFAWFPAISKPCARDSYIPIWPSTLKAAQITLP